MSFKRRFIDIARAEWLHLKQAGAREERFDFDELPDEPEDLVSDEVRRWYANLELDVGAPVDQVRTAYRALMRRYHPDRFAGDPDAAAVAHKLSQGIREAHDGLIAWFDAGQKP